MDCRVLFGFIDEPASHKVYVIPPREFKLKNESCLPLVAGYDLVNANSKKKLDLGNVFAELRLEHMYINILALS